MHTIKPTCLTGSVIQLEPLEHHHWKGLYDAAQDEEIWVHAPSKAFGDKFHRWFDKAITHPMHIAFAVRRLADQKIIGSTRYYDISPEHRRLTIGYTWYIPEVWGTGVNPECKYLLLTHAFEELQANRVEFVVDAKNDRSRAAVKKIGAIEEGLLRYHMILEDNSIRDTAIFSIIAPEWPHIKTTLLKKLRDFFK